MENWIVIFVIGLIAYGFWRRGNRSKQIVHPKPRQQVTKARKSLKAVQQQGGDQEWSELEIPNHRPEGKWVNWTFGSGWFKLKGTSVYAEDIERFESWLMLNGQDSDKFQIHLTREPDNQHDTNAVFVQAETMTGKTGFFDLGYVDANAAAWLARSFSNEMPIAGRIVDIATNGEHYSITVCGLMPAKKAREEYKL